ncbi:MAG: TonB-dependent receptor, partial [Acidobacteria bacterium]|nr:TonB-dependent receptor [Acidobacteriota bacterium]
APIPGAAVKAVKEGTNDTKETRTNADGIFTLPYLDPGTYNIDITAQGFSAHKRTGIVLRVADKLNLPVTLELGAVTESLTVVGEQELIETTTASRGLNCDPIKVQEYPLNGRQSYMLLMLTPGVLFTQQQFGSSGFSGTRGWDVNDAYTMNGGRTGTNQFLLNGAPISTDGTWQVAPNVEAIQEFKVMVNTYDAAYGRSGGGHVNTTIKSGTNDIHGSLFDFWRNTIFDANATQNNRQGAPRGKRNQHQFGGTIGLPIRKDKDFLFFSFEGWREVVPFPVVSSTLPASLRNGDNFTQFNQRIYDPLTSRLCDPTENCLAGGLYRRDPFPGNRIPASRINPIGKKIVDLFPLPNQVGTATINQNFFATGSVGRYRYEQPMFRYDKVISDKDRFYGMFYFQDGSEFRNQNGFNPPAQTGNIYSVRTQFGTVVDWTRVISPATVLDIRLSHARFWQNFPETSDQDFTWDKLGIRNIPTPPNATGRFAPRIRVNDYNDILGGRILNWSSRDQIDFSPNISMTRGRHVLKAGYEWALITRGTKNEARSNGQFDFGRFWTQQYSGRGQGSTDGSPVATLLLGVPTDGLIDFNDTYMRREPYMAWYIQDDWRVSSRLTLNLGFRYDFQYPLTETHDRVNAGFDFGAKNPLSDRILARWRQLKGEWDAANPGNPYPAPPAELKGGLLFAGKNGQPRRTYDFDFTNIQPRVGFAYQFLKKTVARGGLGIFHRTATQGNLTTGFDQQTPFQRSIDGDRYPAAPNGLGPYSLEIPFPNGIIAPSGSSLGLLTNIGRGVSVDGRQRVIPRTYQYSFGIERELGWGVVLEASYVGSRTVHEVLGATSGIATNINLSDMNGANFREAQANPNKYNQPVPNPFFGILPDRSDFGAAPAIVARNLYRRYPLFNGISYNTNPWAAVWYNALQIRFEKRAFSNRTVGALTWVLSYTFAKQLERALRNSNNFENEPFISQMTNIDRPQQLSLSGVWDLPLGKGRRWLNGGNRALNALIGGWNYNWIFTYYEGIPTGKPDAVFSCGDYRATQQSPSRWFNNARSCYTQRAPFTFREVEARFSNVRNPAYGPQLNMALAKKFHFRERYELEFRGESFNVANHPILDGPNTDFTNPLFGTLPIQQLNFPRQTQLGLRLKF